MSATSIFLIESPNKQRIAICLWWGNQFGPDNAPHLDPAWDWHIPNFIAYSPLLDLIGPTVGLIRNGVFNFSRNTIIASCWMWLSRLSQLFSPKRYRYFAIIAEYFAWVIIVIIAIIAIISYTKKITITLGVLTKRILQNILRNKRAVSLVSLFSEETEGRRGDRGP
jgi:hypothetical protein